MVIEKLNRIQWIFVALQMNCTFLCQPKMSRLDLNGHGPEFKSKMVFIFFALVFIFAWNLIESIMKPNIPKEVQLQLYKLKTSVNTLDVCILFISQMFSFYFTFNKYLASVSFSFFVELVNWVSWKYIITSHNMKFAMEFRFFLNS